LPEFFDIRSHGRHNMCRMTGERVFEKNIPARRKGMKTICMVLSVFLFLFAPAASFGVDIEAWKEVKTISTDDLKKLYDAKSDFLLINTLSPIEYAEEHIAGSVNIPFMYLKSGKIKLPDDKNKMLVFYCRGVK